MKLEAPYTHQRFADEKENLQELMKIDSEFLDICKDYDLCTQAILYWQNDDSPVAENRVKEFQEIAEDLAAEISTRLETYRISVNKV